MPWCFERMPGFFLKLQVHKWALLFDLYVNKEATRERRRHGLKKLGEIFIDCPEPVLGGIQRCKEVVWRGRLHRHAWRYQKERRYAANKGIFLRPLLSSETPFWSDEEAVTWCFCNTLCLCFLFSLTGLPFQQDRNWILGERLRSGFFGASMLSRPSKNRPPLYFDFNSKRPCYLSLQLQKHILSFMIAKHLLSWLSFLWVTIFNCRNTCYLSR